MRGSTYIEYKGIILEIEYDYTPGRPGVWTLPNGDPGYPSESPEMDIEAIKICDGNIYDLLSQETIDAIDKLTFDKIENQLN